MKSIVLNLKLILIRKFEYFVTFEVCDMFIVCLIIYCMHGFLLENQNFIGIILICSMPSLYTICDKYWWISEVYHVIRIVSGRKRFSLYKSLIDFATFIDISAIWFTKLNFLSKRMPKNLVTEVLLIYCCLHWYLGNLYFYYKRTACILGFICFDAKFYHHSCDASNNRSCSPHESNNRSWSSHESNNRSVEHIR